MQEENMILVNDLCVYHKIEMNFFYSLQEFGLLEMVSREENIFIPVEQLNELEKLIHMHYDLNINMEGIDVISHLLKRLEAAQQEVRELSNQLKFYKPLE